ncbi:hypothetical protein FA15DRAFT_672127 [Coprinopsis marcescibilis]|uniref:Peptidase M43 pregnancy-associated plasma-A domain-containing protein n=1 Tax=Coprinopsis marcescibilis TaxID=230819 RepID=A0A5C3KPD9_COPMA|nr:hypothetical protein FA15DRAFT_672127 [Coprinopsis marcescibilis]
MIRNVLPALVLLLGALSTVQAVPGFTFRPHNQQTAEKGVNGGSRHGHGHKEWSAESGGGEHREFVQCATLSPNTQEQEMEEKKFTQMLRKHRRPGHKTGELKQIDLPIHFHIIYANDTQQGGMLKPWQIEQQMFRLNLDFMSANIRFFIASTSYRYDPRWFNTGVGEDYDYEKAQMGSHRIGDEQTLNVYTVGWGPDRAGAYGYSHYPSNYQYDPGWDGVLLNSVTMPGGSEEGHNLGRTLVHEVGHWSGLMHTFEGYDCSGQGDYVADTPVHAGPSYYCDIPMDTCPGYEGNDPVYNFMNYADKDYCRSEFTPGQIERMRNQLKIYRNVEDA